VALLVKLTRAKARRVLLIEKRYSQNERAVLHRKNCTNVHSITPEVDKNPETLIRSEQLRQGCKRDNLDRWTGRRHWSPGMRTVRSNEQDLIGRAAAWPIRSVERSRCIYATAAWNLDGAGGGA
jgi:hypothetical protein